MSVFWLWQEIVYGVTYKLTVQQCRNRDSEGRANRQTTFLNVDSYVHNLCLLYSRQMDGRTDTQTDRQTDRDIIAQNVAELFNLTSGVGLWSGLVAPRT